MSGIGGDGLRAVSAVVVAGATRLSARGVLRVVLSSARGLVGARYAGGFVDGRWLTIGPVPRGRVLTGPDPVRLNGIRPGERFDWWPAGHPAPGEFLCVPVSDGAEVLGELYVADKTGPGGFTARDEDAVALLAAQVAVAVVTGRLRERVRELSVARERAGVAREAHGAVREQVFGLRLAAESAGLLARRDPVAAYGQWDVVRGLAGAVADGLAAVAAGLRPVVARDGLAPAIGTQVALLDRLPGVDVVFRGGAVPRLAAPQEEAVLRVLQEALLTAVRRARARRVRVELRVEAGVVVLEVADDGARVGAGERGLAALRARVVAVGGLLRVHSTGPRGTALRLEVPGVD